MASLLNKIRGVVSKKKIRFQSDGFDLDLTYLTGKIIAMGFPAEEMAGLYRNPMPEVQRFFKERHDGNFKIYNLCSEIGYEPSKFGNSAVRYAFDDHNAAPLKLIARCCVDIHSWIQEHPSHVVAVHCKAGKGRTGLILACYFVYSGLASTAEDAMYMFAHRRTHDRKGITIPSQMRYVKYFEQLMKNYGEPERPFSFEGRPLILTKITLCTPPRFKVDGGCYPYFRIVGPPPNRTIFHDSRDSVDVELMTKSDYYFSIIGRWPVRGDFMIEFIDAEFEQKMFRSWLHSSFIPLEFSLFKKHLDRACKDKRRRHFDHSFAIDLVFEEATTPEETAAIDVSPWSQGDLQTVLDGRTTPLSSSDSALAEAGATPGSDTENEEVDNVISNEGESRESLAVSDTEDSFMSNTSSARISDLDDPAALLGSSDSRLVRGRWSHKVRLDSLPQEPQPKCISDTPERRSSLGRRICRRSSATAAAIYRALAGFVTKEEKSPKQTPPLCLSSRHNPIYNSIAITVSCSGRSPLASPKKARKRADSVPVVLYGSPPTEKFAHSQRQSLPVNILLPYPPRRRSQAFAYDERWSGSSVPDLKLSVHLRNRTTPIVSSVSEGRQPGSREASRRRRAASSSRTSALQRRAASSSKVSAQRRRAASSCRAPSSQTRKTAGSSKALMEAGRAASLSKTSPRMGRATSASPRKGITSKQRLASRSIAIECKLASRSVGMPPCSPSRSSKRRQSMTNIPTKALLPTRVLAPTKVLAPSDAQRTATAKRISTNADANPNVDDATSFKSKPATLSRRSSASLVFRKIRTSLTTYERKQKTEGAKVIRAATVKGM